MVAIKSELHALNYDDVILLPQYSEIPSRDSVNLFIKDSGYSYIPIFSAPMKSISEPDFVIALGKLGGIGILHRFFKNEKQRYRAVDKIYSKKVPYGISIGINNWEQELEFVRFSAFRNCQWVVIDTASAYHKVTIEKLKALQNFKFENEFDFKIMVGNVVDSSICVDLCEAGADAIRVNIGSGSQCLTTKSIGIGCPPLTAIADCAKISEVYPWVLLVADGGIYTPRQATESLVFGASALMIGSLFGRAWECGNFGIIYGMSSYFLQGKMRKKKKSDEGKVTFIPFWKMSSLKKIFSKFTYGIKSGLSYIGCDDINKIHDIDIEYIDLKS